MIVFGMSTKLTFEFVENLNCQVFHLFYLGDTYLIIKTPCNSVYIIVYILGIHCTLSNKSCPPTEYIPDVFRKWQLFSLNYDRAIDHQPPCKLDSFFILVVHGQEEDGFCYFCWSAATSKYEKWGQKVRLHHFLTLKQNPIE